MPQSVRSILFVTLSNIGDAILTTPALEALHQAYPDAVIDIVGDARSDIVFRHCPYRGEIFLKRKKEGWHGVLNLVRTLRKKRYDLAVDLRTDGLLWLLRAKQRISKLPSRNSKHLHSAEKHFRAVAPLTALSEPPPAKIWLGAAERTQAAAWLADFAGKRVLALGPGANWPPKIWPAANFAALANLLQEHFDVVLLLGNAQDKLRAADTAAATWLPVLDLCGRTDLLGAAALLEQSRAFVGNDSGLGHLASAVGTPTVTVFGPGEPWRYRPWGQRACWLQDPQCDIGNVAPAEVAKLLAKLLEGNAACA